MYLDQHVHEAEPLYKKAIDVLEKAFGEDQERVGTLYYSLGVLKASRGDTEKAEEYTNKALSILETANNNHPGVNTQERKLEIGKCFMTLGSLCKDSNPKKAYDFLRRSLELHSDVAAGPAETSEYDFNDVNAKLGNHNASDVAYTFSLLGQLSQKLGNFDNSFKYLTKAYLIAQTLKHGDNEPGNNVIAAGALMHMGVYFSKMEKYDEAHNHFKSSYDTYLNTHPNEFHPDVAPLEYQWSLNYIKLGDYQKASVVAN